MTINSRHTMICSNRRLLVSLVITSSIERSGTRWREWIEWLDSFISDSFQKRKKKSFQDGTGDYYVWSTHPSRRAREANKEEDRVKRERWLKHQKIKNGGEPRLLNTLLGLVRNSFSLVCFFFENKERPCPAIKLYLLNIYFLALRFSAVKLGGTLKERKRNKSSFPFVNRPPESLLNGFSRFSFFKKKIRRRI